VAAAREAAGRVHLYPDGAAFALREALAAKLGVTGREVLVGNGSNELVELLVRTFVLDGEEVLTSSQTFVAYRLAAQAHGRTLVEAPMKARFHYDLDALRKLLSRRTKIIFLANPDNPTGTWFGAEELTPFLDAVPKDTLVVLDEAYLEFVEAPGFQDALALRRKYPNVVVLRTFSKIHGLAGLRLGYAVARPEVVEWVDRVRAPFNVSLVAQAAGVAALADEEHLGRSRALVRGERPRVAEGLRALGATVPPSEGNFLLADFPGRPAKELFEAMLREGIVIRPLHGYGFPTAQRITVGLPAENDRCLAALARLLGKVAA
jgi:histidinol-phosphate aminotransferase